MSEAAPKKRGRQTGSKEELDERIDFTARMVARRLYKSDIKRVLMTKYHVDARTCEAYISRARVLIVEWTGRPPAEHRVDSLGLYESIIRSSTNVAEVMAAQARIDKLLGLEAPQPTSTLEQRNHHVCDRFSALYVEVAAERAALVASTDGPAQPLPQGEASDPETTGVPQPDLP